MEPMPGAAQARSGAEHRRKEEQDAVFAFLLLSTSPGYESKEFAIALAGGIICDATVIRALLVPALMRLLGNAKWWMPNWTRTILLPRRPAGRAGLRPELTGRKA